ncbi:MAG: polysaccharide biosynthesis tyrosine autokinase [Lentisphaeraceae bacterium]|nr:polysaccharide biosynthesis tyrosine autokinase [Lentisphaeraceae bacterium]
MNQQQTNNPQEDEIDLLAYLRVLLRYWWFIGPMALVGGIGTFVVCLYLPPKYRAETRFEILENKAIQLEGGITEEFHGRNFNPLKRHVVLLEGETLNKRIEDNLLKKYPELENYKLAPFTLSAAPVTGAETVMLDVSIDSFIESASLEYLNILMEEYGKIRVEESQKELNDTRKALKGESDRLNVEIDTLQTAIEDFKMKNNFIFMETKNSFDRKYIAELLEKANQKQFELDIIHSHLNELKKNPDKKDEIFPQVIDAVISLSQRRSTIQTESSLEVDIKEWKRSQVGLRRIEAEYNIKLKKFKPLHPKMRDIKDNMEIVQAEQEVYGRNILNTLKGRVRTMEAERKSYLNKAQSIEKSFGDHSAQFSQYDSMQQKLTNLVTMKNKVHSKVIAISTDSSKEKYFMRTIRSPQLHDEPVWPQKLKFSALGFILGFGGSSAIILLMFFSKARMYNFSRIIQQHGVSCLATIPHFPAGKLKKDPLFLNTVPKGSVLSESYRSLRLGIEKKLNGGKTLVVTSFGPGEGKTTSSVNLALCWAWTGKKVLLIDGDFRRATLRKTFKNAPKEGLIDYLKSEETYLEDYLVQDVCENLTYLPAGRSEDFVTEILEGQKMREILTELEDEFDMIIIDSAPVMRVVDSIRLSEMTAGTVIVARSGRSNPDEVAQVFKRLPEEKAIGFMVNDFRANHVKYTAHSGNDNQVGGYSYGYAYQNYKTEY